MAATPDPQLSPLSDASQKRLEVRAPVASRAATRRLSHLWPNRAHKLRRPLDQPTAETSAQRQEDITGVPQRSDTPTGTATLVD